MENIMVWVSEWLVGLPSRYKQSITVIFDLVVIPFSLWLAFWLRLGEPVALTGELWPLFVAAPLLAMPVFAYQGLYRVVVRYLSYQVLWLVAKGVTVAVLGWALVALLLDIPGLPRSIVFIYGLLMFMAVGVGRLIARRILKRRIGTHVAIYGAGAAGAQLVHALQYSTEVSPMVFLDDDPDLHGGHVGGLRVYSSRDFKSVQERYGIKEVLIAIALRPGLDRRDLVSRFYSYSVRVRMMPQLSGLAQGKVSLADFQQVDVEDLLGRPPVPPQRALLEANVKGHRVLVTGAGGSIGSELCRQVAALSPQRLVILEQSESALYEIEQQLRHSDVELVPLLGSVLDCELMERSLREHSIETLYHAAAYKHVPIVEDNAVEGVRNNALGTRIAAEAALRTGVSTFVLISTDKAVRPSSVMGASKRLAEMTLQALSSAARGDTRFSIVRFGNVLGSSGSVVPLFRRQISQRKPLTVTDPEATRYFMTVNEAVELVIQAGAMAKGGEIFLLDMGESVNIDGLARKMIHLSGLEEKDAAHPHGDIEIQYTGLRPGEKLNEELLTDSNVLKTDHPKILWLQNAPPQWENLESVLDRLAVAVVARRHDEVRTLLFDSVKV